MTHAEELVRPLAADWRRAALDAPDAALCAYAEKLTRTPWEVGAADLTSLRDAGLDDRAILDACQIVAYFNYVTRIADGLGVELEPYWSEDEKL